MRHPCAGVAAVGWLGSLPMCLGTGGGLGKLADTKASFGSGASVAQAATEATQRTRLCSAPKGHHKPAQGRAQRRQLRSAALGLNCSNSPSPVRAIQESSQPLFRPFRARQAGTRQPGAALPMVALPQAALSCPFRAEGSMPSSSRRLDAWPIRAQWNSAESSEDHQRANAPAGSAVYRCALARNGAVVNSSQPKPLSAPPPR